MFITVAAASLAGCGDTTHPPINHPIDEDDQVENLRIAVTAPQETSGEGLRSASSLGAGMDRQAMASFSDVARILVDITNLSANPHRVVFRNIELVRGTDGVWSATLPFVPRAVLLEFRSRALNAGGTEMFNGVTQQTITSPNTRVTIGLTPYDQNQTVAIPRISRISVPTELSSGGSGSITVNIEGSSGETLRFTATPADGGGEIFPPTGQITLAGTSGSIVFQYTAPVLAAEQVFEHIIAIENPRGTSVQSNFTTRVLQSGQTPGTNGTELRIQFSPIINNLVARRLPDQPTVEWTAIVSDDRPTDPELLTYNWQFVPDATYDPVPAFVPATGRSTTLTGYSTQVSGTIKLSVTDADNGTTLLNWVLPTNQFLNQADLIVDVINVGGVASVVAGGAHSCARLTTGGIRCWGRGNEGQLGYGTTTSYGATSSTLPYTAGTIPNLERATQFAVGTNHSCALFDNGQMACWGLNSDGQLGYNTTQNVGDSEAVASYGYVNVGGNVSRIAVGGYHTCAVLETGNVRCWGRNNHGQLGYGSSASNPRVGDNEAPYSVGDVPLGGALVADVVAGGHHTCALLQDGNVRCWGYNAHGQLGYGNTTSVGYSTTPSTNLNFNGATLRQLVAGENHTCALLTNGAVRCWGFNGYGQIGIPQLYSHAGNYNNWGDASGETPYSLQTNYGDVNLGAGRLALQISAGSVSTCALLDNGGVLCWGNNTNGELGQGNSASVPVRSAPGGNPVSLGASVVRLASGSSHSCALLTTGRVRCWGYGGDGRLGYGNVNSIGDNEQVDAVNPIALLGP